jgi:hypothetical protein
LTPAAWIRSATARAAASASFASSERGRRGERLELEPVQAHDGDFGAHLLGEVCGGVGEPWLVRSGLGRDDYPLHAADLSRRGS